MAGLEASMPSRCLADKAIRIPFSSLVGRTALPVDDVVLAGSSVLVAASSQLNAALMMMELDGVARRMVLCPPGLDDSDYRAALEDSEIDLILSDNRERPDWSATTPTHYYDVEMLRASPTPIAGDIDTEWVLFTSGTSGRPKLAVHSLASLVGVQPSGVEAAADIVWSTFYDVRRYGGLQILLRAALSQSSMVFSSGGAFEPSFLDRARAERVTHLSGTPSHWRLLLATGGIKIPTLKYIRLSGETCDQSLLAQLAHSHPSARITHAFASTEAGLVFEVTDMVAGVPLATVRNAAPDLEIDVTGGSLRVRSGRCASRYLGHHAPVLRDPDGFVDTGDLVEDNGDRLHFLGRRGGIINVGGSKIHPETVESVINRHPAVRISRVRGSKNPIMGSIVVGDIVITDGLVGVSKSPDEIKSEIMDLCREWLPKHHVPVRLQIVASIALGPAGKMLRNHA